MNYRNYVELNKTEDDHICWEEMPILRYYLGIFLVKYERESTQIPLILCTLVTFH